MEDVKAKATALALKHSEAVLKDLLIELAVPLIKSMVEKSETKLDDNLVLMLEEPFKKAAIEMIDQIYKG